MLIKTIPVGHLETNCYIVTDENTLGCAVIHPRDENNTNINKHQHNPHHSKPQHQPPHHHAHPAHPRPL